VLFVVTFLLLRILCLLKFGGKAVPSVMFEDLLCMYMHARTHVYTTVLGSVNAAEQVAVIIRLVTFSRGGDLSRNKT
jgi:hypothetical protein